MNNTPPAYGATRQRGVNVTYADVERAALAILADGRRPAVASVRQHLGRGAPATVATGLARFWRDLGVHARSDPAALTRLPAEIIETVETLWQRALTLAAHGARHDHNAARERLAQITLETEIRAQSFARREQALETAAQDRERALADTRDHLLSTLKLLESDRAVLRARDARIADLEAQLEATRQQLATVVKRAIARTRTLAARKPRGVARPKPKVVKKPQAARKPARRTPPLKRRSQR